MTFLRNVGHDLVDKKLWPIAVALVLAVIAVPFLLGGGGEPAATPVAQAPVAGAAAVAPPGAAEVAVAVEEPVLRRRSGKTRDPFKQQYVRPEAKVPGVGAVTGGTPAATGTGSGGKTTSTPATSAPATGGAPVAPTSPARPRPAEPELDPLDVYRVNLRFGEAGRQRTIRDIARLSPLPNSDKPFFIFLGVLAGGKKAVFLVGADAAVTGDGVCRPSRTNCETVEMGRGDTVFLDRETSEGVTQYELDLLSVRRRTGAQAVAARQAQASASERVKDQEAAKDQAAGELTDTYRWDADRGVLVRRKVTRRSRTTAAEAPGRVAPGPSAQEYRDWYIAVYLEYLRQLAAGSTTAAAVTHGALDAVPQP